MNLAEITWILDAYFAPAGNIESAMAGSRVTLEFDATDGAIAGNAGCNRYRAVLVQEGD